ncbi:MAG: hypothetical protein GY771_07845 [bacterium]|nr:hypothetical protein [bacterium]
MSSKKSVLGFVLSLIGLWPILFFGIFIALLVFAGDTSSEFSLETRNVVVNQTLLLIALGITFVIQVVALIFSISARRGSVKGGKGRALSFWGIICSAIGIAFFLALVILGLYIKFYVIPRPTGDDGDEPAIIKEQCIENQGNIEIAIGPGIWGVEAPEDTPEDIVKLDLSPYGDLIETESGIKCINEESLDCPVDEDPDDTDYELYLNDEGKVKAKCIDPEGIKQGHNER